MPSLATIIGANVRRVRLARGWTQEQFAERADIDPSTVSRIESGTSLRQVAKVGEAAQRAGIDPLTLLQVNESRSPQAGRVADMFDRVDAKTQDMVRHMLELSIAANAERDAG